jgi:DNA-binding NarL/FixJ family response regulator
MASRTDDPLTPQEHNIIKLVALGENDAQIAQRLQLSQQTVTNYVQAVCQKLRRRNRITAAVYYYLHYGIAELDKRPVVETEPLTEKEIQVIDLLARGYPEQSIANQLALSKSTVTQHLLSIRSKFDVPNRVAAAVEYYRRSGRTDPSSEPEHNQNT